MNISIILKVELIPGTDIDDAASDMCELANRVGTLVEANFNGVKLWARPGDKPLKLAEDYYIQLQSMRPSKIAQAPPEID